MKKKYTGAVVIAVIALIVIIIISSSTFVTIHPGERGVIFRKFSTGLDKENIYGEGFHIIAPWNEMFIYDVKEQIYDVMDQKGSSGMDVLDKNGLTIHVDATVRFFPVYNKIGYLHQEFGTSYREKLVIPEVRSEVRKVMGRYTAEEIYSTKRKEVEQAIVKETGEVLNKNNITMKALLVRSIKLPPQIKNAIENKLKQEQEALAYQFRLEKEKSEAERKRIAAEGEARANEIINNSLTTNLLKMRGIEATIELTQSQNSKVVIIGNSKDGLPMILGGD